MPWVSCAIVPHIHFHRHGALVVLKKPVGIVQVTLVMHKHSVPYIIWHIITCVKYLLFCWDVPVQFLLTRSTVSNNQSHGHHTPSLNLNIMMYYIWCIYPCEYLIYTRCSKTFFLRVQWTSLNILFNFPQSSMSLFSYLVFKKPTAFSKSGLDLFMVNNNFPTTKWKKYPFFSLNCLSYSLPSKKSFLKEMWPTYWCPHQFFLWTTRTVRPYWFLSCCT